MGLGLKEKLEAKLLNIFIAHKSRQRRCTTESKKAKAISLEKILFFAKDKKFAASTFCPKCQKPRLSIKHFVIGIGDN